MRKLLLMATLLSTLFLASCNTEVTPTPTEPEIDPIILYGPNYKEENTWANKQFLYGMCDLAWSEYSWNPDNPSDFILRHIRKKNNIKIYFIIV